MEAASARGRPASDLADAFAARVKARSDGRITVVVRYEDPEYREPGPRTWPWVARHLDNVRSGRVDLATVWAPSLELAGIKTARALHVPFVLTSEEAAARATRGELARRILSDFDRGLVGLTLAPQGLTRVFSAGRPLVSVADFSGAAIRTPYGPDFRHGTESARRAAGRQQRWHIYGSSRERTDPGERDQLGSRLCLPAPVADRAKRRALSPGERDCRK